MSDTATTSPGSPTQTDGAAAESPHAHGRKPRVRLAWVHVLIAFTTVLAVIAIVAVWTNRLLFSPDNWANTSTQLLENPAIRSATANYVVDQLYANVNVAGVIQSGLPTRLKSLAGPAAGALRGTAVGAVDLALTRPKVQSLWGAANRAADETFVAIVNRGTGPLGVKSGKVTLNLDAIAHTAATRLGIPPNLISKLPPTVAHLTVLRSNQLRLVQVGGNAVRRLALWLTILVPLLYAVAIGLARGYRRRTLMTVGFSIAFAGVLGIGGRSILESQIPNSLVKDASLRPAATAVVSIATGMLGTIAGAFVLVGAIFVAAAWFAGPAPAAAAARRALAPYLRERPHRAFAITGGVMVLIFLWQPIPATGTPAGIIVFMLLALIGTEVLRRQTATEFPDAEMDDTRAMLRARRHSLRVPRRVETMPPARPQASLPDQLERLAALRAEGALTAEEFDRAKAVLLHT